VSITIHPRCLPESKAYKETYGKYESSMFCYHCGLPLTPAVLPDHPINYELLQDHFFGFELESIRLLEELEQTWSVPLNAPFLHGKTAIDPQNSSIRKVYDELKIKMPEWLAEQLNNDENSPETNPYHQVCDRISKDLMFIFHTDLSRLENTEKFQRLLIKYRSENPEDYNVNSRSKEIWAAAQDIKKSYERAIQEHYDKLLGPEASLYSCIDLEIDAENYDFDKSRSSKVISENGRPLLTQTFAIKSGRNYFHPYCADRLGLNDSHCNDHNSRGGETNG